MLAAADRVKVLAVEMKGRKSVDGLSNHQHDHKMSQEHGRIVRTSLRPVAVYARLLHKKQKTVKKMEY